MKTVAIVFVVVILGYAYPGCIHDQVIKNKKLIPINDTWKTGRLLQELTYGPIRFHYIYEKDMDKSTAVGQNIVKIMQIIKLFWQKTIEVYYQDSLSFNIPKGSDTSSCGGIVPEQIIRNPIPNADYGVFIYASQQMLSTTAASSQPCAMSLTTKQPTWGYIKWNAKLFQLDVLSFQMNVKIGIHQFTHLLGFSSMLYDKFVYGKVIVVNKISYFNGTYIQKAIKDQYGCTNAPGMPLQMNGDFGTAMSHWSFKTAFNEYMAEGVSISNPTISFITLALLQETGWYKAIYKGYGQYLNWGYKKGCRMIFAEDCNSDQFCLKEQSISCDYDSTGYGRCKSKNGFSCLFVRTASANLCTNPNYNRNGITTGEYGGQYSRCFQSNLVQIGANQTPNPFRCYKTMCSISGRTLTIQIGSTFALCLYPRQKIIVPGFSGFLTCPKSFKKLCAVKRCPKQCEGNGVCLNGRCLCTPSYSGEACDQVTSVGFASKMPISIASRNNYCLLGSYKNFFGDCEKCSERCGICGTQGCIVCMDGSLPDNDGMCYNHE